MKTETQTDTLPGTDRTGALDDLSPPTKLEKFEVKKPKPKPGQPSKFNTRTASVMLRALRAGLTHAQACRATGIARETLYGWMDKHADFRVRVEAARDEARRDALEDIKEAGKEDWKALAQWLRLAFPEYRRDGPTVNVSSHNQTLVLCDEETRAKIQEMRQKLLGAHNGNYRANETNDLSGSIRDAEFEKLEEHEGES
jgi:transposase-like protein